MVGAEAEKSATWSLLLCLQLKTICIVIKRTKVVMDALCTGGEALNCSGYKQVAQQASSFLVYWRFAKPTQCIWQRPHWTVLYICNASQARHRTIDPSVKTPLNMEYYTRGSALTLKIITGVTPSWAQGCRKSDTNANTVNQTTQV